MAITLATTGFVSNSSGSVASANAVLLSNLLDLDFRVKFFSKPTFVDPRPAITPLQLSNNFTFVDCTNTLADGLRRHLTFGSQGVWGRFWGSIDATSYKRALSRSMLSCKDADLDLWLGDWAGSRGTRPVVSFVQGPPGTDARSVLRHRESIIKLGGRYLYAKLAAYSHWRLGPGLPDFSQSDHIIVGSNWARDHMIRQHGLASDRVYSVPYPIDLEFFKPIEPRETQAGPLRLLWLGRFIPRKRLDLLLAGLEIAIRDGCKVEAMVIGQCEFVPNFERLLDAFPFPENLTRSRTIARSEIPKLFNSIDAIVQPSEEENFGSSVAEALACGKPAIVGRTNGTADYLCDRSIILNDYRAETLAEAIIHFARLKQRGDLRDSSPSRAAALKFFDPKMIAEQLNTLFRGIHGTAK